MRKRTQPALRTGQILAGLLFLSCLRGAADTGTTASKPPALSDLTGLVEQWVALQREIQAEKTRWQEEKKALEQTRNLLAREARLLREQLGQLEEQQDRFDAELAQAEVRRNDRESALASAAASLREHRQRLEALHARLPTHLQRELAEPLAVTQRSEETRGVLPGARAILGYYAEAQRLQQEIRTGTERLAWEASEPRLFDVLVLGWSTAYAVSRDRAHAGFLVWDGADWTWQKDNTLAPTLAKALRMARTELPPQLLALPVHPE